MYATSLQNYTDYVVIHTKLAVLKRLEIAIRFPPLGIQRDYNVA